MRKVMYIEIKYTSEIDEETKREDKQERKRVLEYLKELIESDFHERYKLKIKELIFED